jgi:DNA-binding transcriptional MocR family regulator
MAMRLKTRRVSAAAAAAAAPETRYARVADHVRQMIERAVLRPGMRVPSVRRISGQQRVSVTTVQAAYRLLERDRLIESRPRSGYFVCETVRRLPEPSVTRPPSAPRLITLGERGLALVRNANDPRLVPLGAAVPSLDLLPVKTLSRLTGRVARQCARDCTAYDALPGCRRFREQVSRRALDAGCVLDADGLVATTGAMEALHLALRAVARPGDVIAVESPTFFGALQLLESLGLRALEVATDPRTGVVLDELVRALDRHRVAACLFSPNFQNPTGCRMPDGAKRQLVKLLADREVPLIEDDVYGELPFEGPRPQAAKAFDTNGGVLWCASLSKTLAPGLRAGWIAGGRFHAEVERLKSVHTVTGPPLPMLVAAEFLESGQFDRHLRALRATIAQNVRRVTAAVVDCFPPGTQVAQPAGGMVLWVEMPKGVDSLEIQRLALEHGIGIAPGPIFSPSGRYQQCLRINCAMTWSDRIERALAQVGLLARQLLG